jgi:hypothetical protein
MPCPNTLLFIAVAADAQKKKQGKKGPKGLFLKFFS